MSSTFTRIPFTGTVVDWNLMPNPSFEVGTSGWAPGGSASAITRSTFAATPFGSAYCTITGSTTTTGGSAYVSIVTPIPVTPGQEYTLSAYFCGTGGASTGRVFIRWLDGASATITEHMTTETVSTSPSAWTRLSVTAVAPPGAATADFFIGIPVTATTSAQMRVDACQWEEGPLTDYIDGSLNTPDNPLKRYEWTGTPHNSASWLSVPDPAVDQIAPDKVVAPYTAGYEARTIRHQLMQSETVRVTFVPVTPGAGVFDLLFTSPAAAKAAVSFFRQRREFYLDTPGLPEVGTRFVVGGGSLELKQDDELPEQLWHVMVPWQEYPL